MTYYAASFEDDTTDGNFPIWGLGETEEEALQEIKDNFREDEYEGHLVTREVTNEVAEW